MGRLPDVKKILLTGSEGFVGRNLKEFLERDSRYWLCCPKQAEINLTVTSEVAACVGAVRPEIIIHSATSNTLGKDYEHDVCEQNLRMFFNLVRYRPAGCVIYTLCSGSSYNRNNWVPNMSEDYLGTHIPTDAQGFSKFVIASHARTLKDFVILRLFGIFGKYEDYRYKFIANTIAKRLCGLDVTLFRDCVYHYLDVNDFCAILQRFIEQDIRTGEFNVTPDAATKLSEIIEAIDDCLEVTTGYSIATPGFGRPYTGANGKLGSTLPGFRFTPLKESISGLVAYYRENIRHVNFQALEQDQLLQHAKVINAK